MNNNYSINDLISFEDDIAKLFNKGLIKAPVHLYSGNEKEIIKVFKKIKKNDWVLCSWRSHYQCLLKGVPKKKLTNKIIEGKSISLCFPEYKIFSSAIVGGIIPIAVGIALALKLKKNNSSKVYCFAGDMTSETGIFHECYKFSKNFNLPIKFVVEDNELSVCTDTKKSWGLKKLTYKRKNDPMIIYYKYNSKYPHAGAGVRVQF